MSRRVLVAAAAIVAALVVVPGGAFLAIANIGTGGKVAIAAGVVWWVLAGAIIGKTLLKRRPELRTPVRSALALAAVASIVGAFLVTRGNTVDEEIVSGVASADAADSAELEGALGGSGTAKAPKPKARTSKPEADAPKPDSSAGSAPAPPTKPSGEAKARKPQAAADRPPRKAKPAPTPSARNVQLLSGRFSGESGHRGTGRAAVVKLAASGKRMLTFSEFDVDPGAGGLRVYLHAGRTASDDLGDFVEIARLKGNRGDQQYELPGGLDLRRYDTVVIWCVPFSTRIAQAPLG